MNCPVNYDNERDPHSFLLAISTEIEEYKKTGCIKSDRKVRAKVGLFAPCVLGYTRNTTDETTSYDTERWNQSLNSLSLWIADCNSFA